MDSCSVHNASHHFSLKTTFLFIFTLFNSMNKMIYLTSGDNTVVVIQREKVSVLELKTNFFLLFRSRFSQFLSFVVAHHGWGGGRRVARINFLHRGGWVGREGVKWVGWEVWVGVRSCDSEESSCWQQQTLLLPVVHVGRLMDQGTGNIQQGRNRKQINKEQVTDQQGTGNRSARNREQISKEQ